MDEPSNDEPESLDDLQRRMDDIQRQIRANERFLETGRYTDYLIEKEEDPHSSKATFLRGFQQGCPIGALSMVLAIGALLALVAAVA